MLLTPIAITAGLLVGLARGGRLANLRTLGLRWVLALIIGLLLQSAADQWHMSGGIWLMILGSFVLIAALGRNLHLKGMTILSIGMLLNLTVIAFNGHIPTRFDSLIIAGVGGVDQTTDPSSITRIRALGEIETADTKLAFLGDIIPLPLFSGVISFGDLIILSGLFVLALNSVLVQRGSGSNLDEILGFNRPLEQARSQRIEAQSGDQVSAESNPSLPDPAGQLSLHERSLGEFTVNASEYVGEPIVARRQTVIDLSEGPLGSDGPLDLTDRQSPDRSSPEDELLAPFPFPDSSTR